MDKWHNIIIQIPDETIIKLKKLLNAPGFIIDIKASPDAYEAELRNYLQLCLIAIKRS